MKKALVIILTIFAFSQMSKAQTGTWSGKLDINGAPLSIVFHLDEENPTMDSPDQNAHGVPIKVVSGAFGKITITIPSISASFEGMQMINSITGTFTQMGMSFPLMLSPGENKPKRPQTPSGPFPYTTEEVTFDNGDAILKGTLVLPQNCSRKTPVFIMVTGSGQQNRDEELFEHKPFAVIADALAREGIATLRYDDRGCGESTGDFAHSTTDDFKEDALAGVKLLKERFDKVGVIGHSEGGTIAFMLAAGNYVDFIVSLAGMVVSGAETLVWQNRVALASAGVPQSIIDTYCKAIGEAFEVINNGGKMPQADALDLPDALKQNYLAVLHQIQSPYLKRFISIDMRPLLGSVKCPVLAINGTKDNQVDCQANLDALRSGLPDNQKTVIESVEGVNHLFQHCNTGAVAEYNYIEEIFSPEVLKLIAKWVSALE